MNTNVEAGDKLVRVELLEIQCTSPGSNGGDSLQIYGSLDVMTSTAVNFWKRNANNAVDIPFNRPHHVGNFQVFTVKPGQVLNIFGHLWEKDTISDDDMGTSQENIRYDQISPATKTVFLRFNQLGQKVQAIFIVNENV